MRRLLIALAIVVGVLVVLVAVVELAGRPLAQDYVRGRIVDAFPGTDPTVTIGGGSLILQALGGHLDDVEVTVPGVSAADASVDLTISATGVPISGSGAADRVTVRASLDAASVQSLVRRLDALSSATVTLDTDEVSIASSARVLLVDVPYGFSVTPSVDADGLLLTPTSASVGGATIDLSALASSPIGAALGAIVRPQTICVAQYLPAALPLTAASVAPGRLTISASGAHVPLDAASLSRLGTCP